MNNPIDYDLRKHALERELNERKEIFDKQCDIRETVLAEAEDELHNLRQKVAQFPQDLHDSVEAAIKTIRESLEREHRYAVDVKTVEIAGERKLLQQTIISLQAKVKEQEALIDSLNQKASIATEQVQTIALKALESRNIRLERSEDSVKF